MANSSFSITTNQEEDKQLAFFQRRSAMSVYFEAVRDASLALFNPANKPAWYDTLNNNLDALKTQSQQWFDDQASPMTNIPQAYIDFATAFTGQYGLLTQLMNQLISSTTGNRDSILANIKTIMDAIAGDAQKQQARLSTIEMSLQDFLGSVSTDIGSLTTGTQSITDALDDQKDTVVEIVGKISDLQSQLSADTTAAMTSGIVGGAAFLGTLIAIGIAIADPVAGAIAGAVIAGVALAGAVVPTVIYSVAIGKDQKDILEAQQQLSDANKEVLVLNGISLTVAALLDIYDNKSFSLTDLISTWTQLEKDLYSFKDQVMDQQNYQSGLKGLLSDLEDLKNTLDKLTQYSTVLQDGALTADSTPIQTYNLASLAA